MTGMRHSLLIIAMVMGQSILAVDKKPLSEEESAKVIEAAIRRVAKKPTGELTKADLEKLTFLSLGGKKLTKTQASIHTKKIPANLDSPVGSLHQNLEKTHQKHAKKHTNHVKQEKQSFSAKRRESTKFS